MSFRTKCLSLLEKFMLISFKTKVTFKINFYLFFQMTHCETTKLTIIACIPAVLCEAGIVFYHHLSMSLSEELLIKN